MRITPENITELKENEIFVFGSNLAGRHGKGAARQALKFGARYWKGFGFSGNTYAIPTKGIDLINFSISEIGEWVFYFIRDASLPFNIHYKFLVTKIGCGLAGYTPEEIAPLFTPAVELENVYLPSSFWEVLNSII